MLRTARQHNQDIDSEKTPIIALEVHKMLRIYYIVHYKVREMCKEMGTPDYSALTELDLSI